MESPWPTQSSAWPLGGSHLWATPAPQWVGGKHATGLLAADTQCHIGVISQQKT